MQDERLYDEKELEKSWLLSYSDLISLLFVIIVIIAATSASQFESKLREVKQAEAEQQTALQETIKSKDILELQKLELQREIALLEQRQQQLVADIEAVRTVEEDASKRLDIVRSQLAAALHEMNVQFEQTPEGLMIRLPENVLFTSGSAELQETGRQVIASVAGVLQRFPHLVRIEGYTDNVPIANSRYRTNWELSAARALSVMREMVDQHQLPPSRFIVAGLGERNPVADNTTAANRARNRRVELVILPDLQQADQ
ncbi:OmpA family protein [Brevibacillus humidisoli]|uniref:OmpA family protein n=1 Tax=Brevibacillus humidisoli TaxID=2895522 RepID=UPI001E437092|nr:OmpA family protein [Brevibacillus humidisoli]UFJ40034.1 OmpA family protein [Brevibacillus humidisoli]